MAYRFQKLLESATDQTLVEPNWEGILECVDMIRGGEVPVKEALKSIQKRFHSQNPHTAHHALMVLEACVKNCGKKFVSEIATKDFMEDLKSMAISNSQPSVQTKILELIQCWTSAFKGIAEYKIVEDTHSLLKMNGFEFPPIDEAKAMFLAESAPDWAEGDNCYRCRVEFGVFTRKHHCRACGQIFCDKCSSKQMLLPQFGIEKKVRVCEACFDKKMSQQFNKVTADSKAAEDAAREQAIKEAQEKEQEELELALALSQSEAEAKAKEGFQGYPQHPYKGINDSVNKNKGEQKQDAFIGISQKNNESVSDATLTSRDEFLPSGMADDSPFDSALSKYLDRDYWERKRREAEEQQLRATAPPPSEISISVSSTISQQHPHQNGSNKNMQRASVNYLQNESVDQSILEDEKPLPPPAQILDKYQINGLERDYSKLNMNNEGIESIGMDGLDGVEEVTETSQFCHALKERVDTMKNRMRSNQLRGRSIVNDSAIHSLFTQLTHLHGTVVQRMTKLEEQRDYYERLQDHLAHIQEARQAVNALREENERLKQERLREEQNRRQVQLRQKLELMRHKKREMLMTERCAAIQRFQDQERQIRQQRFSSPQQPLETSVRTTLAEMPTFQMGAFPSSHQSISVATTHVPLPAPFQGVSGVPLHGGTFPATYQNVSQWAPSVNQQSVFGVPTPQGVFPTPHQGVPSISTHPTPHQGISSFPVQGSFPTPQGVSSVPSQGVFSAPYQGVSGISAHGVFPASGQSVSGIPPEKSEANVPEDLLISFD